jgi:ubiquinone/menaquinone biosynthesis C-methylase UbiE/uncharacterized protein YbaR (Trm112 family)
MTNNEVSAPRWIQIAAWVAAAVFIAGFFLPVLGAWTGAVLAAWFIGTQRPLRGFLWLVAFTFVPGIIFNWRRFPLTDAGWMLLIALLSAAPFLFHRLVGPRLPGFGATLPLPFAGAMLQSIALAWLPAGVFSLYSIAQSQLANAPLLQIGGIAFLIYWFGATLAWMWTREFRGVGLGGSLFAVVFAIAAAFGLLHRGGMAAASTGAVFAWISFAGCVALAGWALFRPKDDRTWAGRSRTMSMLRSPYSGSSLQVAVEQNREVLVSASGERFPIRDGIPVFLKPGEITGANLKYNHLYETIGGFYDDTQRVWCGLRGVDRDAHFRSYLRLLEIKPGDAVLETSVGTGLNFKYLPRSVRLYGLDLSAEMLANCQVNLRRWDLDAELFLGNAESLPFADGSLDVVFHVGGINFFSDRAAAIREMIRVAKPGSLILIADETEKHVQSVYQNMPVASGYFKDRPEAVSAPVDLVPPEMLELRLTTLFDGQFYALTFRKPE